MRRAGGSRAVLRWVSTAAIGLGVVAVLFIVFGYNVVDRWPPAERARSDVEMIASQGVEAFRVIKGRYPRTEEGVQILLDEKILKPNNEHGAIIDPWGREYVYVCPGKAHPRSYDVLSYGADGKPGGEGEDADVVNR